MVSPLRATPWILRYGVMILNLSQRQCYPTGRCTYRPCVVISVTCQVTCCLLINLSLSLSRARMRIRKHEGFSNRVPRIQTRILACVRVTVQLRVIYYSMGRWMRGWAARTFTKVNQTLAGLHAEHDPTLKVPHDYRARARHLLLRLRGELLVVVRGACGLQVDAAASQRGIARGEAQSLHLAKVCFPQG